MHAFGIDDTVFIVTLLCETQLCPVLIGSYLPGTSVGFTPCGGSDQTLTGSAIALELR